jgi:transcriptional regulator with XRE-family HTH domain
MSSKSDDDGKPWLGQSDPMVELGRTIKTAREAINLSQDQLAEKIGVTRAAVSAWENGDYAPGRKRHRKLADALGITVLELLSGKLPAPDKPSGTLIAIQSNGAEIQIVDIKSVAPVLWSKTRQRVLLIEDQEGHQLGLLATDETIQALESCLLILRELL